MAPPADLDGLTHADLKSLVLKLLEQVAELQRTVAAQRDEIARLKGGPGRPNIRPSGMEQATEAKPAGSNRRRPRGGTRPELRRFVLAQYHQGQVTVPRLVTLLRALGILVSKRQVMRLLNKDQDGFLAEARDVLRAGLISAAWITVDDTGVRDKATT